MPVSDVFLPHPKFGRRPRVLMNETLPTNFIQPSYLLNEYTFCACWLADACLCLEGPSAAKFRNPPKLQERRERPGPVVRCDRWCGSAASPKQPFIPAAAFPSILIAVHLERLSLGKCVSVGYNPRHDQKRCRVTHQVGPGATGRFRRGVPSSRSSSGTSTSGIHARVRTQEHCFLRYQNSPTRTERKRRMTSASPSRKKIDDGTTDARVLE